MDAATAQNRKIKQYADFEVKTAAKIDRSLRQNAFNKKKAEYEMNLNRRRQELADLYNRELAEWRDEAMARVETQEDRKARIKERAYQLRDARESARQAEVKAKYDLQWRDACDDARTLDSKAMLLYMNQQRLEQIEEKKRRKAQLSQQENAFFDEWNRQLEALAARDAEKRAQRAKIDKETSDEIKAQMEYNYQKKLNHYQQMRKEEQEELDRLRAEIERIESEEREKIRKNFERGQEDLRYNAENRRIRDEESLVEREQDAVLLDYALRKEREQLRAEEEKRNAGRQAALQYRKYLEEQMIKEAEDTAAVDEIRRREEERVWKARDDALQAREDARNYLMQMVDEGRQEQIRSRRQRDEEEAREGQLFAQKFLREAHEAVEMDRQQLLARKQQEVENQRNLLKQIEYKRMLEDREKQEAYLADKQMQHMERLHQKKLAEQAGTVRGFRPLLKNQWYT